MDHHLGLEVAMVMQGQGVEAIHHEQGMVHPEVVQEGHEEVQIMGLEEVHITMGEVTIITDAEEVHTMEGEETILMDVEEAHTMMVEGTIIMGRVEVVYWLLRLALGWPQVP